MATLEERTHLGPYEVGIDSPLYGIVLVGGDRLILASKVTDSKKKAIAYIEKTFNKAQAYVVRIDSTNS